jgi:tetratricopeptide (TPR) repeat protein
MVAGVLNPLTGRVEQEFYKGKMAEELLTHGSDDHSTSTLASPPVFHRYVPPTKRVTGMWWLQKMELQVKTMGRKIIGAQLVPDDRKDSPQWQAEKKKLARTLAPPKPIAPAPRPVRKLQPRTKPNPVAKPGPEVPEVAGWQPEAPSPLPSPSDDEPVVEVLPPAPAPEPAAPTEHVVEAPVAVELTESDEESIPASVSETSSEEAVALVGHANTLKELLDSYPPSQGNRMRNHLVHAAAHYGSGSYKDAVLWLDAAMDVDAEETLTPTDVRLEFAVLLTCRGILMRKLGMLDAAFDNLQAAKEKHKLKEQWHHTAHGHLQRGSTRAAIAELTEATVKYPDCGIAYRFLGDLYREQANTHQEHQDMQAALELATGSYSSAITNFRASHKLATAGGVESPAAIKLEAYLQHCIMWRGVSNALLQKPDLAVDDLQLIVNEFDNYSRDVLVRLGDCCVATHQYTSAWRTFNGVVDRHPKCAMAYCQRGRAVFMTGFPSYSLKDLNKANKLDLADPLPLYYRACLRYSDNPNAADLDFSAALRLDPNNAHMLAARGVLREAIDREKLALHDYIRALEIQPKLVQTRVNLGFVRMRQNPPDTLGALDSAETALKHDSNNPRAWVCKGEALRRMTRLQEAQSAFAKALHSDPKCAVAYFCRGFMLAEMDENRLALYDLLSFLRCSDDPNPRLMGQAYLLLDQHELAAVEFRKVRSVRLNYIYSPVLRLVLVCAFIRTLNFWRTPPQETAKMILMRRQRRVYAYWVRPSKARANWWML